VQLKETTPSKKKALSSSEVEQLLKSQCKTQQKISIVNWTCPFVSCGDLYNSGFIFSRGKGNKLHVLNAETLQTEVVRETEGHGLFCCRVYNDLAWVGCYDGHLFVFDVNTFAKKFSTKLQQGIYDIMVFEDNRAGFKEDFLIFG
jgi:outer membrane protein assembly factor BamB